MLLTYFILILDSIRTLCFLTFGTCLVVCLIIIMILQESDNVKKDIKYFKYPLTAVIVSTILLAFTPTTKQAALIFLSGQEDVVATAKNLPKLTKLGTDYLVELLEEGKKDVNKH